MEGDGVVDYGEERHGYVSCIFTKSVADLQQMDTVHRYIMDFMEENSGV